MVQDVKTVELSVQDFELLQAALHTQKKILSVQSAAGGTGSHRKLADLDRLMTRLGRARNTPAGASGTGWTGIARGFLSLRGRCA